MMTKPFVVEPKFGYIVDGNNRKISLRCIQILKLIYVFSMSNHLSRILVLKSHNEKRTKLFCSSNLMIN